MEQNKNFQLILLAIFVFLAVIGIFLFATSKNSRTSIFSSAPTVFAWGVVPQEQMSALIETIEEEGLNGNIPFKLQYTEVRVENLEKQLLEALATNEGPDILLFPQDQLFILENKLLRIPFESYPERDFRTAFIEGGELFIFPIEASILALPFSVDPLVMYWNRDIFSKAGLATTPEYWDEFLTLAEKLTKIDEVGQIAQSMVALGGQSNIGYSKEILTALILQIGNPLYSYAERTSEYVSVLTGQSNFGGVDFEKADSALRFYTEFANPSKPSYSWNKSLPDAQLSFLSGDSAIYFGFASDLNNLHERNPNLNFDVAALPQVRDAVVARTYGKMIGLGVLKSSRVIPSAFSTMTLLTSPTILKQFAIISGLPPSRRDLLSERQTNKDLSVFYDSAIISRAWLDPNPNETRIIFNNLIETSTTGGSNIGSAINRANDEIDLLYKN